jgi:hypothetical protein
MSTLTDRYVWGVLRAVPAAQRADLEPEIRAMVADAIEAQQAAGAATDAAERAALTELGDPDALASRYTDRAMVLIGPRWFPEWKRLLTLLLPIVVPIAILAVTGAAYMGGQPPAELVGVAITAGFNVAIQLTFWITLVFAVIERSSEAQAEVKAAGMTWTPDRLPELPKGKTANAAEVVVSCVAMIIGAGFLVWQQTALPVMIGGVSYPILDPALWSFWMPWFLGLLGIELLMTFLRWRRGGWTYGLATVNLATNIAFAVPALWLFGNGNLFDPGLEQALSGLGLNAVLTPAAAVVPVVVAAASAWDAFDGFRQAWMRSRG